MVFIVTGPLHAGKTARVRALVETIAARGVSLGGYLSRTLRNGDGITGYDLEILGAAVGGPLLRKAEGDGAGPRSLEAGSFQFVSTGLDRARDVLKKSRRGELLVVDEVGPAELDGRGVWPELSLLLADPGRISLLVVRESLVDGLRERLKDGVAVEVLRFDAAGLAARVLKEIGR